jgi:hypothetical protein
VVVVVMVMVMVMFLKHMKPLKRASKIGMMKIVIVASCIGDTCI